MPPRGQHIVAPIRGDGKDTLNEPAPDNEQDGGRVRSVLRKRVEAGTVASASENTEIDIDALPPRTRDKILAALRNFGGFGEIGDSETEVESAKGLTARDACRSRGSGSRSVSPENSPSDDEFGSAAGGSRARALVEHSTQPGTNGLAKDESPDASDGLLTPPLSPPRPFGPALEKLFLKQGLFADELDDQEDEDVKPEFRGPAAFPLPLGDGLARLESELDFRLPYNIYCPMHPFENVSNWKPMTRNLWLNNTQSMLAPEPKTPLCMCEGDLCDEDCVNRLVQFECDPSCCPAGKADCGNRALQVMAATPYTQHMKSPSPSSGGQVVKDASGPLRSNPPSAGSSTQSSPSSAGATAMPILPAVRRGVRYARGYEIFQTSAKGFGLRATRRYEPFELVLEYTGEVITVAHMEERLSKDYKGLQNYYCLSLGNGLVIDSGKRGSEARFVNHSCRPNCNMEKWGVKGIPRVGLYVGEEPIPAGTEFTYDYNFDIFGGATAQTCHCGSARCRGVIGKRTDTPSPRQLSPLTSTIPAAENATTTTSQKLKIKISLVNARRRQYLIKARLIRKEKALARAAAKAARVRGKAGSAGSATRARKQDAKAEKLAAATAAAAAAQEEDDDAERESDSETSEHVETQELPTFSNGLPLLPEDLPSSRRYTRSVGPAPRKIDYDLIDAMQIHRRRRKDARGAISSPVVNSEVPQLADEADEKDLASASEKPSLKRVKVVEEGEIPDDKTHIGEENLRTASVSPRKRSKPSHIFYEYVSADDDSVADPEERFMREIEAAVQSSLDDPGYMTRGMRTRRGLRSVGSVTAVPVESETESVAKPRNHSSSRSDATVIGLNEPMQEVTEVSPEPSSTVSATAGDDTHVSEAADAEVPAVSSSLLADIKQASPRANPSTEPSRSSSAQEEPTETTRLSALAQANAILAKARTGSPAAASLQLPGSLARALAHSPTRRMYTLEDSPTFMYLGKMITLQPQLDKTSAPAEQTAPAPSSTSAPVAQAAVSPRGAHTSAIEAAAPRPPAAIVEAKSTSPHASTAQVHAAVQTAAPPASAEASAPAAPGGFATPAAPAASANTKVPVGASDGPQKMRQPVRAVSRRLAPREPPLASVPPSPLPSPHAVLAPAPPQVFYDVNGPPPGFLPFVPGPAPGIVIDPSAGYRACYGGGLDGSMFVGSGYMVPVGTVPGFDPQRGPVGPLGVPGPQMLPLPMPMGTSLGTPMGSIISTPLPGMQLPAGALPGGPMQAGLLQAGSLPIPGGPLSGGPMAGLRGMPAPPYFVPVGQVPPQLRFAAAAPATPPARGSPAVPAAVVMPGSTLPAKTLAPEPARRNSLNILADAVPT